ncbi:hypothetical protein LCGC14_2269770 [marine sediment metagenome]|uniref:Uncharacterized protein n=1 Tax=marine sediment metagenome TaxID=412755 RepID=A0A0F9CXL9_9ZZZZ
MAMVQNDLGVRLCEVIGIDSAGVNSLTIKCVAGKADEIIIGRFVKDSNEVNDIIEVFKDYKWEKDRG